MRHGRNVDAYNFDGYQHEYLHRNSTRGGGVSFLIKHGITYKVKSDLQVFNDYMECIFIEIDKHVFSTRSNIIIGIVYRIPNTDVNVFNDTLENLYKLMKPESKLLYVMGDFNINLFNMDTHPTTSEFVDLNFTHSLLPLIDRPTRITKRSAMLLDNIFTNNLCNGTEIFQGILYTDISDHFPIFMIELNTKMMQGKSNNYTIKRIQNETNQNKFWQYLTDADFNSLINIHDAQHAYSSMHKTLELAFNLAYPKQKVNVKYLNRKTWLSAGLKKSIKRKNNLYASYMKSSNPNDEIKYKAYKNKLNHLLHIAEKHHYTSLLNSNKNNLRKSWKILKEIINKKKTSSISTTFRHNGKIITDELEISESFNIFFV